MRWYSSGVTVIAGGSSRARLLRADFFTDERRHDRLEQDETVGAAERPLARTLGVRHQADDVPRLAADARDVVDGAVRVRRVGDPAALVAVAEDNAPRRFELANDVGVGGGVALAMRHRHLEALSLRRARGERRVGLLDADEDLLAVEL